jgi:hypothetical protein
MSKRESKYRGDGTPSNGQALYDPQENLVLVAKACEMLAQAGLPAVIVYIDSATVSHTNPQGVQTHTSLTKDVSVVRVLGLAVDRIGEVMSNKEGMSKAGIVMPSGMPAPDTNSD